MAPKVTTLHLAHLPPDLAVHLALFEGVSNAGFLRRQLLEGNTDFEYAFLDARTILSSGHVLAAVFRAVNDMLNHRMKSRNVHSEIVFALSPNNNIAESFRKFGITESTTNLLVVKVSKEPTETVANHLQGAVQGEAVEFSDANLERLCDLSEIKKIYKLNSVAALKPGTAGMQGVQGERKELEIAVLGQMALRGAT